MLLRKSSSSSTTSTEQSLSPFYLPKPKSPQPNNKNLLNLPPSGTLTSSISTTSSSTNSTSNSSAILLESQSFQQMEDEFEILKTLSEGTFSKVLLAQKASTKGGRISGEKLVLKAILCDLTTAEEFQRELSLNYFLSPHPNIVTCFNVSFLWNRYFVFVQEYAPLGPLSRFLKLSTPRRASSNSNSSDAPDYFCTRQNSRFMTDISKLQPNARRYSHPLNSSPTKAKGGGLDEAHVKAVAMQVASALEFIHGFNLVHRDVSPWNVLVFREDFSLVKLSDFGCTRANGSLVMVTQSSPAWFNYAPPEVCELLPQEKYYCYRSADVWQLGILIYTCITGHAPWTIADELTDPGYSHYCSWLRRKSLKTPEILKKFSSRFVRMFKRLLEPKSNNRFEVQEVLKYLKDDWVKVKRNNSFSSCSSNNGNTNEHDSKLILEQKDMNLKNKAKYNPNITLVKQRLSNRREDKILRVERWIDENSNPSPSPPCIV